METRKLIHGFSLLEMVVAIAVFAVVASIAYGGLIQFLNLREDITRKSQEIQSLQIAFAAFERDVRYLANRSVRDNFGDYENPILTGTTEQAADNEFLRLTTSFPSFDGTNVQQLRRVAWRVTENKLERLYWSVLDRDQGSENKGRVLLDKVQSAEVSFLSYQQEGGLQTSLSWEVQGQLPDGIEFRVRLGENEDSIREFRRVFEISNGT